MLCRVLIMRLCCHGAMWGAASAAERTVVELWLDWAEVVAVPVLGCRESCCGYYEASCKPSAVPCTSAQPSAGCGA